MKKIFLVLALAATLQAASAQDQVKSVSAAKSAVEKAAAAAENSKQNTKFATWLKYGQALLDAKAAPAGSAWLGMGQQEAALLGGGEKPLSEEQVTVNGQPYLKQAYATKNYYFGQNGQLALIEVTKPIVEDALPKALDAFKKAYELDAKKSKTADIANGIKTVSEKYIDDAYTAYTMGDNAKASEMFEAAFNAAGTAPYSQLDTNSLYNAAFTAFACSNNARAKSLFNKCIELGYAGEEGDAYAKLASIAEAEGNSELSKDYLEKGFSAYPQSQGILVGLINYYVNSGENTGRLFELLDGAKKNEPNNASLYYVEGNIHEKLGESAEAVASYLKCSEINPDYEFGYVGLGVHYYNAAVDLQEKASQEMDDNKYNAYMEEFETALKACIAPFEKAYEITKSDETKTGIAEYLKNACFRFRTESQEYMDKYNKYAGN